MIELAMIGCGGRATGLIYNICKLDPEVKVVAVADPDAAAARARLAEWDVIKADEAAYFPDIDALLASGRSFDGAIIGTHCHLHTPMAIKLAPLGVPLLLEKPVAITMEQLEALAAAYAGREDSVVVSFPLRVAPLFGMVRDIVRSGRLGTITQLQAVNNVSYGGVYFGTWYRNHEETRDLWMQKATHDLDYVTHLLDSQPQHVVAMETRTAFGGDMPAGLHCSACDLTETCMESPVNLERRGDRGGLPKGDHPCVFGEEIRHHDAASALIQYANGAHAAYSQNFVARRSAGRRGATLIGYKATLTFDFIAQTITIIDHHTENVENVTPPAVGGHFGGDRVLGQSFLDVLRGNAPSATPLTAGLLSAAVCLAAGESCRTGVAQRVVVPAAASPAAADR